MEPSRNHRKRVQVSAEAASRAARTVMRNGQVHELARSLAKVLETEWARSARWKGIRRDYSALDVVKLRGTVPVEHSLARAGAHRFGELLAKRACVTALGAMTGGQAVQQVRAGMEAIYVSGWQTAADANLAGETYPDRSLYPANSVPALVRRINSALRRADQIGWSEGEIGTLWMAPIVADAEAGFGGVLNAFELMKALIEAGAACVHFEDQLASEKKCGHLGGRVLSSTRHQIQVLTAARLAADVMGVPTFIMARTDALGAKLLVGSADSRDEPFLTGEKTPEGYLVVKDGLEPAIQRSLAYAPYADLLWFETSRPDLDEARAFAETVLREFPEKHLAYNCSPSFNWRMHLGDAQIARFNRELAAMGYRFQFVTLAGFHTLNASMFELAKSFSREGMPAYVRLQTRELEMEAQGYTAAKHQREVGTGYFDRVAEAISQGAASTLALSGSTEEEQFVPRAKTKKRREAA